MTGRTVYIVDGSADFREATRAWLMGAGFDVTAWGDAGEAIDQLAGGACRHNGSCACLLLDLRMPPVSGLVVHDALLERGARIPVIYVTADADVAGTVRAMQRGALTVLEKPVDTGELDAALDSAFADRSAAGPVATAMPPSPAALPDEERARAHARYRALEAKLAPRERQVLGYVILGVYNKNIADRLGISIKTVELYRARGMAKMRAGSVAELTRVMITQRA
ncbi:MAG: response regulator transcription factor [Burkholderiaceae bacterium]|nr:response regulator transcription factor [Burkholderiaceae bacterium]